MSESKPYRIGVAGLGTVGCGLVELLRRNAQEIAARAGRRIEIAAVSARDPKKARAVDLSGLRWCAEPLALTEDGEIDAVVELVGGSEGVAKTLAEKTIQNGKDLVTANKALLAHHGHRLALAAEKKGVALAFEAAVAGGIPIIKTLREGLAANRIHAVYGILNGTCNYILSQMRETKRDFAGVLAEAQEMGYAEADPSFDVDGIDAAHKLSLLSALAFGVRPDFESLSVRGIRSVGAEDIAFAGELGHRVKLLGMAQALADGSIARSLEPCLVPERSLIGKVEGVFNAVLVEGDAAGQSLSVGRGAGAGPTASAVAADLIDLARGIRLPVFGVPAQSLGSARWAGENALSTRFYLHLKVKDQPGVLADITAILRDLDVSVESVIQRGRDDCRPVPLVFVLHETGGGAMKSALERIESLDTVLSDSCLMRIAPL